MKRIIILFFLFIVLHYIIYYKIYQIYEDKYEDIMLKEFYIIKRNYKRGIPMICSRKYTTSTLNTKQNYSIISYTNNDIFSNYLIKQSSILIAIHSHLSLFYHRHVFRRIYQQYRNISLLFFIGLSNDVELRQRLHKEMRKYKDIVLFNFYCNYFKLYQLTSYFLKWVKENQKYFDIIIKQDTDTFLNIHAVLSILNNKIYKNDSFVLGKIWFFNNKSKQYPSGMSYIFKSKSVNNLVDNIEKELKQMEYIEEDKFFGFLARRSNFIFYDSYKSFHYSSFASIPTNIINLNNVLMIHTLRISEIAFLHFMYCKRKYFISLDNGNCTKIK